MICGSPFGDHFGSLFDIFCDLKHQKACLDCRHDYCQLLSWKYADFWCPHLSICMVNIDVFIRFHFFDLFMNLMISGRCLSFILDTLGGLGGLIWWFLGYWRLLEISLIFRISPEPPQAERPRQGEGKVMVQGALQPTSPGLADLRSDESSRLVTWLIQIWSENLWLVTSTLSFAAWWPLTSRGRRIYIYI